MESLAIAIGVVVIAFVVRDTVLRMHAGDARYAELLEASRRRSMELDAVQSSLARLVKWRETVAPSIDEHERYIEAARLRDGVDKGLRR